jgi:hypothetical protein
MADVEEIRTLIDMLSSASHHAIERFDSERDRFIERGKHLASEVTELLEELGGMHETLETACQFLTNGAPIHSGSDLHSDLLVCRDRLAAMKSKGGAE